MDKELMHEIIVGDSLDKLKNIESESIDLIITDPPYNLSKDYGTTRDKMIHDDYLEWLNMWLMECKRVLKKEGTIYVFMGVRYISYLYDILENGLGLNFNSWITWHYTQGIGKKKGFSPRHDDILMFTKSKKFTFNLDDIRIPQKYYRSVNNMRGANPGDVWEFSHVHYSQKNRQIHPTQKPEGLIERMILASSNKGETVLDPFLGSGTTLRVAHYTNRKCIGIEINKEYVDISKKRLKEPFNGFDSVDSRVERVPNDLNDKKLRMDYVENHIQWFLRNHEDSIIKFLNAVKEKYAKKIDSEEEEYLDSKLHGTKNKSKQLKLL